MKYSKFVHNWIQRAEGCSLPYIHIWYKFELNAKLFLLNFCSGYFVPLMSHFDNLKKNFSDTQRRQLLLEAELGGIKSGCDELEKLIHLVQQVNIVPTALTLFLKLVVEQIKLQAIITLM